MPMLDGNLKRLEGARRAWGAGLAGAFLCAAFSVGQAAALAGVLAALWAGAELSGQAAGIAAFASCWAARCLVKHLRAGCLDRFARAAAGALRGRALGALYDAGPAWVGRHGSAAAVTTLLEGIDQVRAYLAATIAKTADLVAYPVAVVPAAIVLDPTSGVIVAAILPVAAFFMALLGGWTRENAGRQFAAYRRLANRFADSLRGIAVLKAFGAEARQADAVYESSEELRRRTMRTLRTATVNSLALELFRVFALAAVAIMLGFRLMAGEVALFPALCVLLLVPELFGAVTRWAGDFHTRLDGRSQLAAALAMADAEPGTESGRCPLVPGEAPALAFEGVRFRYAAGGRDGAAAMPFEGRSANGGKPAGGGKAAGMESRRAPEGQAPDGTAAGPDEPDALGPASFEAHGPCRIGIVGESGAGKTTLARLLAGFASPTAGVVRVNGAAGGALATPGWRAQVAYLPQHPHIFNDTLRANIAFYRPDAGDAAVARAAEAAGLGALVRSLPDGLDTIVGEGARSLSGGQAQRVALARVFLDGRRRVIVFDEPTAHLDIETEAALAESMERLMEGRLVFFATHRLHWMRAMDRIIVLDGGRVAQVGTYEELAAQEDGAFARLLRGLRGEGSTADSGKPAPATGFATEYAEGGPEPDLGAAPGGGGRGMRAGRTSEGAGDARG